MNGILTANSSFRCRTLNRIQNSCYASMKIFEDLDEAPYSTPSYGSINMDAKSAIDHFAAGIIYRVSVYLTACLAVLLMIAIIARQLDASQSAELTLVEEFLALFVTLLCAFIAVWCAGYLAIASTKRRLLLSMRNEDSSARPPRVRRLLERATQTFFTLYERKSPVNEPTPLRLCDEGQSCLPPPPTTPVESKT